MVSIKAALVVGAVVVSLVGLALGSTFVTLAVV
jgi:hypothetical protein